MQQNFRFVSMIPIRRRRPRAAACRIILVLCLVFVAVGLAQGLSLLAAVGPVGFLISYALLRLRGSARETVSRPAEAQLSVSPEAVTLTWPDLDGSDGRGPRAETWRFPAPSLREARFYAREQALALDGPGERVVTRRGAPPSAPCRVTIVSVRIADGDVFAALPAAMARCGIRVSMR